MTTSIVRISAYSPDDNEDRLTIHEDEAEIRQYIASLAYRRGASVRLSFNEFPPLGTKVQARGFKPTLYREWLARAPGRASVQQDELCSPDEWFLGEPDTKRAQTLSQWWRLEWVPMHDANLFVLSASGWRQFKVATDEFK